MSQAPSDFVWSETDEPHATRRKQILSKHPEIKDLFVNEPRTFYISVALVSIQLTLAYLFRDMHWGLLFLLAWCVSGTINHTLQLAVHEVTHNLCFENSTANRLLAIFCNLPTGVPSAMAFQQYHHDHHQFQGVDGIDTDIGTAFEGKFFSTPLFKALWVIGMPLWYAGRPLFVNHKSMTPWKFFNFAFQFAFDATILYFWGFKSLAYLILGSVLGMGLHPCAGHFIAEHFVFTQGSETYSYYGSCNWFNLNVGFHNEHHDFPRIPWSKLPQVRKIAPEFYENLPSYTSYLYIFKRFIFDPTITPFSRVKRAKIHSKSL